METTTPPTLLGLELATLLCPELALGPVRLYRIQMGQWRKHPSRVDVTMMSAKGQARAFAPTKEMVYGTKYHGWTNERYTAQYLAILEALPESDWRWLRDQGAAAGELAIGCYCSVSGDDPDCPDFVFCHGRLLVDYAVLHWPLFFTKKS